MGFLGIGRGKSAAQQADDVLGETSLEAQRIKNQINSLESSIQRLREQIREKLNAGTPLAKEEAREIVRHVMNLRKTIKNLKEATEDAEEALKRAA